MGKKYKNILQPYKSGIYFSNIKSASSTLETFVHKDIPILSQYFYFCLCCFTMDPTLLCKAFFTLGTIVNVGGTLFPSFRQQIMNYGSRSSNMSTKSETNDSKSQIAKLINFAASYQVPHTWFLHYYLASVASSIFWAIQILSHGKVFRFFASYSQQSSEMTVNQVFLAWLFMAVQGVRRVYECITLTKPSQSKMWIGIWLVGIAYYLVIGISVWIEGIS